ncbi:zinc transporter ZIP9-B-like [Tubulanus polymorphus]|uniref:zinc transporter ZIP9-B-like n=1 Tax=Tubulanus polymorphus TaxID=672921 RepID=UPI003DA4201D
MEELWTIVILSIAMLIGCYIAGSIPLAVTMSEDRLKLLSVFGAGLLVGTALAVIIPEGVHSLYETKLELKHHHKDKAHESDHTDGHHHHDHDISDLHSVIGVALVLGFVCMLLVDKIGGGGHSHTPVDAENGTQPTRSRITATLGLVVHAAADGVALGAAATTSQTHVTMIVFVAIMLHKAPAAFGLVSFLLHEGFDRMRIRRHLLAFAAAAPLLAMITYFGLSQQSKETLSHINATGIAMLFSAGTFLFVATVHVLPEIANMPTRTVSSNGNVIVHEHKGFTMCEVFLLICGALIPVLLSIGHHH